jgi:hypothetical protein
LEDGLFRLSSKALVNGAAVAVLAWQYLMVATTFGYVLPFLLAFARQETLIEVPNPKLESF